MYSEVLHEGSWMIQTDQIELGFSLDTGMLTLLRRREGPNLINIGSQGNSLDVETLRGWMQDHTFARYLTHRVEAIDTWVIVRLEIGLGVLKIQETYRITGTLVARSVRLSNSGINEEQILHVRLALPFVRVGPLSESRFEAPSNSFRPRLSTQLVAQLQRGELPGRAIAPAIRRGRLFENAPDRGPGLLALHSTTINDNLLCWYWSKAQTAWPGIHGNQEAISLEHDIELAGWLAPDAVLEGGTQYFMLVEGTWLDAMRAFQQTWNVLNVELPAAIPEWVRQAQIYEVHPALAGGFNGLTEELPTIRELGFNTLNLMPIWQYDNKSEALWDLNWQQSGSPYAIEDFEQLEPTLGTPADFKHLVDTAHALGIRVICDLVVQGCSRTSQYLKQHPGWFCRDHRGRIVSSHGWNDTASFDWANPEVQTFFTDWTSRFVEEFNIDGWRVDAPHRKEPNWDRRLERSASSTSFGVLTIIDNIRQALQQRKPDGVLLCELYGPLFTTNTDFSYDYLAHLMIFHAAMGTISAYELGEWLEDHFLAIPRHAIRVCFTETHDTRDVNPIADAVRGSPLARLLMTTVIGCGFVPMVWGQQAQVDAELLTKLFRLREQYSVLRSGTARFNMVPCDDPQMLAIVRSNGTQTLGILINLGPHRRTVTISLPVDRFELIDQEYRIHDILAEQDISEQGRTVWRRDDLLRLQLTIDPFAAKILQLQPQTAP